jgi:hypothetical protein
MMADINIKDKIQLLHSKTKILIESGKDDKEIIAELIKDGVDQHYGNTIIGNVRNDMRDKKEFWKHILTGTFITIAGLLINYLSWKSAEQNGSGMYLLIWGIVVAGIITIIRGVILFRK